MSKFTDELKRLDLAINLPSKTYFAIEEKFKDWQPPKQLVEVPRIGTDYFDVDLLSSSIDEIERVLIGNKSDEVNAVYLKNAIRFIKTHINGMEENKEWINQIIELVPVDEVEG